MSKQNTPNSTSKQTPVICQQIIKTPLSSPHEISRKVVKSVNTPRSISDTALPSQVKLFPPTQHDHVNTRSG